MDDKDIHHELDNWSQSATIHVKQTTHRSAASDGAISTMSNEIRDVPAICGHGGCAVCPAATRAIQIHNAD